MDARHLLGILNQTSEEDHAAIIASVKREKGVFEKPGLRPNAIDCIDKAVQMAKAHKPHKRPSRGAYLIEPQDKAFKILRDHYNAFCSVLYVIEKSKYWERRNGRQVAGVKINAAAEIDALRQVFNAYMRAKLQVEGLAQYAGRII